MAAAGGTEGRAASDADTRPPPRSRPPEMHTHFRRRAGHAGYRKAPRRTPPPPRGSHGNALPPGLPPRLPKHPETTRIDPKRGGGERPGGCQRGGREAGAPTRGIAVAARRGSAAAPAMERGARRLAAAWRSLWERGRRDGGGPKDGGGPRDGGGGPGRPARPPLRAAHSEAAAGPAAPSAARDRIFSLDNAGAYYSSHPSISFSSQRQAGITSQTLHHSLAHIFRTVKSCLLLDSVAALAPPPWPPEQPMWPWHRLETLQLKGSVVFTAYQRGPSLPLAAGTPLQLGERGLAVEQGCESRSPPVQT
ncbi:NAD-dependent protein deacetylase sirtuin-3, mitochondrial isoform X5 [Falco biarmicus]|uniref:NAD-dependent protein deacetylase sirtuin-3, mitochondrial isoform X5 n=1 Tax=Falco biarmicus TaxID=345155 RepID=UPI0024BC7EF0|nr:NAD-dependent protein deacetylase sirtuin-3, mitochondrial isoform X5 [Falco biarmicus]